ncbi:MAG: type I DNA topoisomerase [Candidatus Neomarinimicrobiota bacterium]
MSEHPLIIVESPSKARTLQRVLGEKYDIVASVGHIRDLPPKDMGVDLDGDFRVTYQVAPEKKKVIALMKKALKGSNIVYLATDPDREGEAISQSLVEILKIKVPTHRLVFHELTRTAILGAFEHTRPIDENLVKAQETRRILDRLVGYEISPVLWRKIAPRLSAGRVQSVAVRLVVDRERARFGFKPSKYYDLQATFTTDNGDTFAASLVEHDGLRLVIGKDFDRNTGALKTKKKLLLLEKDQAAELSEGLLKADWTIREVEEKPAKSNPSPPFTTSTLQQAGANKLNFSAKRTMQLAQRLYESGYITYMRTDSTTLSHEALMAARKKIKQTFGPEYLPDGARIYKTKVKNAQEAHEAIRPAGSKFRDPSELSGEDAGLQKLYQLIYKRTLACQMKPALLRKTTVQISDGTAVFQANGKVIEFPGYLAVYQRTGDEDTSEEKILPPLSKGQQLTCEQISPEEHETKPQARYTEASLIKDMESLGIGRPSTYASIMDTIQRREYVFKKQSKLIPSFTAIAVVRLMETYFTDLVDYQFTARMEDVLDEISRGEQEHLPYLRRFYFGGNGDQGLKAQLTVPIEIRRICTIQLGKAEDDVPVNVRIGKFGPYLEYGDLRTSIDPDTPPSDISMAWALEQFAKGSEYPKELGIDSESGQPVLLKKGRFGFYLQLGPDKNKLKQKSLLPGMTPEDVNLDTAMQILALPRNLGDHPETGDPVIADLGKYGPYLKSGKSNRSLSKDEDLLTLGLDRAVEILKSSRRNAPAVLSSLGSHPETKVEISIKSGRYGPYITDGTTNVSLKRGEEADGIGLDYAIERLAEKAARGPTKRRRPARSKRSKKKAS